MPAELTSNSKTAWSSKNSINLIKFKMMREKIAFTVTISMGSGKLPTHYFIIFRAFKKITGCVCMCVPVRSYAKDGTCLLFGSHKHI